MSEQPEGTTRDIAEDGTQRDPQSATPGGGGTRGPALGTGGDQEAGGPVPPYDGRQESAPVDDDGPYKDGARVGGATGPVSSDESSGKPDPADTARGEYASPSDEKPATEEPPGGERDQLDPGVGPAHETGTKRGEDQV